MIGSDWPVCTVAGKYDKVMNLVIDYMSLCVKSESEKVLGLNCQRIYKISYLKPKTNQVFYHLDYLK